MIILGIDPGTTRIGYGIIKKERTLTCLASGLLEIKGGTLREKLEDAHRSLTELLRTYSPELAALETIYFSKNKKTAIDVAHARGVMMLTLAEHRVPIAEYTPQQVKQAVTGYGSSDKKAVIQVLARLFKLDFGSAHDDVSDAIAIALTAGLDNSLNKNSKSQYPNTK